VRVPQTKLWTSEPTGTRELVREFLIADVFTDTPLEGNQLGIFLDGRGLSHDMMLKATREMNFAETVFFLPPDDPKADAHVRIFTPGGKRSAEPLVVAVGRLVPVKRFDLLIDALALVRRHVPGLRAVIAGEGYERARLEAHRRAAGAEGWIDLPGYMDDAALLDTYRRAWVLASTSQREGWGMTISEAGACATPAVATRIAGHRDAVEDGVSGLLVDLGSRRAGSRSGGVAAFAEAPRAGEVYNLGGGKANSTSILEAFKITESFTGRAQVYTYVDQNRIGDHICYYSDLRKIRSQYPKWNITQSLQDTIAQIVESWRRRPRV